MYEAESVTQAMTVSDVQNNWNEVVNAVSRGKKRITLEQAGMPVAALVSAADLERLQQYDVARAERFKVVERMRAAFADVPDEEIEREVAKAIAEVREEMLAERQQTARPA